MDVERTRHLRPKKLTLQERSEARNFSGILASLRGPSEVNNCRPIQPRHRHCLLLRSKRERPSGSCSCNRCDEFASLHCSLKPRLQCLKTARLQQGFATSEMGCNNQFALQKS